MIFLKLTNLVLLLAATAWLTKNNDWEPFIVFFTLFSAFIFQEVKDAKKAVQNNKSIRFDRDLFFKYENLLPEKLFLYGLNNEVWNFRTDYGFMNKIKSYLQLAESTEGKFINARTQKAFINWIEALAELREFIATHFFTPLEGVDKNSAGDPLLLLYPELKYGDDVQREKYNRRAAELHHSIEKAIEQHTVFRKRIKKQHLI